METIKSDATPKFFEDIYNFFGDIEAIAYDFLKSLLIDCDSMRYLPSLVVCSVISTTIEIYFKLNSISQKVGY